MCAVAPVAHAARALLLGRPYVVHAPPTRRVYGVMRGRVHVLRRRLKPFSSVRSPNPPPLIQTRFVRALCRKSRCGTRRFACGFTLWKIDSRRQSGCHIARNWGLFHSRCSLREKGDVSLLKLHGVQTSSVAAVVTLSRAAAPEWIITRPPAVTACRGRHFAPRVKQIRFRCAKTVAESLGNTAAL